MAAPPPDNCDEDLSGPTRTSVASNPSVPSLVPPATPSQRGRRTERPIEPEHVYHAFEVKDQDEATIGNKELIFTLKIDGQLGVFYDREACTRVPIPIEMDVAAVRDAIIRTLTTAVERLMVIGKQMEPPIIPGVAAEVAQSLANGIMVMFYQKLRYTNYLDPQVMNQFYRKPKVPVPFEVPQPYALAISQLGQIKASGLPTEVYVTPVVSAAATENFCLPQGVIWSPVNYCRTVEYAKKIGLQFATVDLHVKMGSTWWLHRPVFEQGVFALHCPLPEENFTKATAILATLFCSNGAGGFFNPIFNIDALGNSDFGTMLRNPPDRVDVSTFFAIEGTFDIVWKVT